jgi:hypothetical protein
LLDGFKVSDLILNEERHARSDQRRLW